MMKFGEILNVSIPVLIEFYAESQEDDASNYMLRDVVAALGDKAKVVKIDVDRNELLVDVLKIKTNPTFIIYKDGLMQWRQSGDLDANTLIALVQRYF